MDCSICETRIKLSDGYHWDLDDDGVCRGAIHDDCLIRVFEFQGDYDEADKIQIESTLPKG